MIVRGVAHWIAENAPPADSGASSGSALLGIAAVISAIGVAIGGVIGSVTALIKAWRTPVRRDRDEDDDHE